MLIKAIKTVCVVMVCSVLTHAASANLLINPTRVQFNPGDRSDEVTLINTSQMTTTYRLEWAEKRAKAGGGYHELNAAEAAQFPTASKMLRFSPRQVTLKAGERQTIKLAVRRPAGLATGEYRSHLLFKALPPPQEEKAPDDISLAVNIVLSFAIPVVVREGDVQYHIDMNSASLSFNPGTKESSVIVDMSRTGIHSTLGNIVAYWTPAGGQEKEIARVNEYSFWPELDRTNTPLISVGSDFAPSDGKLRIIYEGIKDFRGVVFFEKTINVKRSAIFTAN